jgi:DNA-binding transcriptional regulator GbsR (MarR family)
MSDKHKPSPELDDVVSQIGDFIEYWGFKNVHGRIWAHLFLAGSPLDAADLCERLKISKALASISINDLLEYEVILTAPRKTDRGTLAYEVNPRISEVISNVVRKRERRMLARLSAATRVLVSLPTDLQAGCPVQAERAKELHDMVQSAEKTLDSLLQLSGGLWGSKSGN